VSTETGIDEPNQIVINANNNEIYNQNDYININWQSQDFVSYYEVQFSLDYDFCNLIRTDSIFNGDSIQFTGFETNTQYFYRIRGVNAIGKGEWSDIYSFNLTSNNYPIFDIQSLVIEENSLNGSIIGTITATDPDNDTLTFGIISGNEYNTFYLDSISGVLSVIDSTLLDFEQNESFELIVKASDYELSDTAKIIIGISNLNEIPSVNAISFAIEENSLNGSTIGTITATDPDNDTLTFEIISGNEFNTFYLDSISGVLSVIDSTLLDFEQNESFEIIVKASDYELSDTAKINIQIIDLVETSINYITDNSIKVYPNPNHGIFYIESDIKINNLKIYKLNGKLLMDSNINKNKYEVNGISSGVYILQVQLEGSIEMYKIIVE